MEHPAFRALPTMVGSFPHPDPQPLLDRIFRDLAEVPVWPQMPCRDWRESMYIQYSEGLPGASIDEKSQNLCFRTDGDFYRDLETFYQAVIEGNVEPFAISRDFALGFHLFVDDVRRREEQKPAWLKGQVTGPFSFAMTVTDEKDRAMAYNPELFEVAVKGMGLKARWVPARLRELSNNVLVTLDEPYLCSFGSAFVNVPREDVISAIDGAAAAVHEEGALAGVHCCGNTDWSLVLETCIDVISFDAYEFFLGLSLYPAELKAFLERGGTLAWGIVPTSEAVKDLTPRVLLGKLDSCIELLAGKGMDRSLLFNQALLTPSCGMGSKSTETADRVFDRLVELSALVRGREGFK